MGDHTLIVVGVDGSAGSDHALWWALGEASIRGDKLLLVHAWQFPALGLTTYGGDPLPVFGREDIEKIGKEVLGAAARTAGNREPGVPVETRLVEGDPVAALVEASHLARLIVVGSRGVRGFGRVAMGSVSSSVANDARCPVVIVPTASMVDA